ncbi:MAG: bacterial Ig-like domain-containing protein, partial [Clostridia bacterium]|nr:bacterial Ig-like domain-containing protein [Clostridia bacterium]
MMKKFLSILIVALMLMQMFTFSISAASAPSKVWWTGEFAGEVAFSLVSGVREYHLKLYKNNVLVADTTHSFGDYDNSTGYHQFVYEILENGSGTYRVEVGPDDGSGNYTSSGNYVYKKPSTTLDKTNVKYDASIPMFTWAPVAGAVSYDAVIRVSWDGGETFESSWGYGCEGDCYFNFWDNWEEEMGYLMEEIEIEAEMNGYNPDDALIVFCVEAYPADFNDANPSYSDYVTFDGITIPDSGDEPVEDGAYSYMEIIDYQNEYYIGQEFYAELRLVYVSSDGTETYTTISSKDCEVEGFDPYTPGWQVVTVTYGDYSEVFKAHVIDPEGEPEEPTICEVRFENAVTEYQLGEDFYIEAYLVDTEGKVYRTYAFEVDGFDSTRVGQQEVTVSFGDYSETYVVYVNENTGTDGTIGYIKASMPNVEFFPGDEFYAEVYVYTPDGSCYQIEDYKYEGFDSYTPGEQIVTIWYGNLSTTVTVWVYEEEPVEPVYTVEFENVKTKYEYGEEFYIEVYRYIDGEKIAVSNDEWWVEGYDPYMSGWQEVTVFCENRVETYRVYVAEEQFREVRFERVKKQYYEGEEIEAEIWYETEDGRHEFTEDFEVEGYDAYFIGEQNVTISFGGYSEDFTVTVKPRPIIDENVTHIRIKNLKTLYYLGEEFEAEVYAYTKDGNYYMVEDYLYYDFDSSIADEQQVTVRYGDFTDDCVVCVYENELTENLSGTCGDKLTWTLDTNGVLTISGTGAMT